jgi:hypothetical protein
MATERVKQCEPGKHVWKDGAMQRYCDVCLDVQSYYAYSKQLEAELAALREELAQSRAINRGALEAAIKVGENQQKALDRVCKELGMTREDLIFGKPLLRKEG